MLTTTRSNFFRIFRKQKICFVKYSQSPYVEEIRKFWLKDPSSVHPYWDVYFKSNKIQRKTDFKYSLESLATPAQWECEHSATIEDTIVVNNLIKSYQFRGHYKAKVNPLKTTRGPFIKKADNRKIFKKQFWEVPKDASSLYCLPDTTYIGYGDKKAMSFDEIVKRLEYTYCESIGVESVHVDSSEKIDFIRRSMEVEKLPPPMSKERKIQVLTDLIKAGEFEKFLSKKWPSEKRFGLEGNDSFIPAVNHIVDCGASLGANSFIFGMAHRGRLNLLVNVLKVKPKHLLAAFQKFEVPVDWSGTGDVKYHLGTVNSINTPLSGRQVKVALLSNPSHLEAVDALVLGKAASEAIFHAKGDKSKTWPILIHGDAAMAGQGIVYECVQLSKLQHFSAGGAIHIVVNNQVGFTTDPKYSCSFEYPTAILKMVGAPVFHVNGDDVEAVIHCCQMAAEYRAKFQTDVGINIIGYRRNGHNETDEPRFTQPLLYKIIDKMKHVQDTYAEQLISEGIVTKEDVDRIIKDYEQELEKNFVDATKEKKFEPNLWIDTSWEGFAKNKDDLLMLPMTGVDRQVLDRLSQVLSMPPATVNAHPSLVRIFKNRADHLQKGIVDWPCAETFAFGSLLQEGINVRLSGQDVERGTFSHRHHVIHDQTENSYRSVNLLDNVFESQATYTVANSMLSEFGVLGFELGASLVSPDWLVVWEAQFGDFANTAQVIIDQFLAAGEDKWMRQSGITLSLPHGMEGMGAEHSSARVERFLQLSNDDEADMEVHMAHQMASANWLVVEPSTPANFFHVLRRQMKLNYRKPLILIAPKALLRLPECVSQISELTTGTMFKPYLPDPEVPPNDKVKKLIFCSGKMYYELRAERELKKLQEVIAIARIEQLFPLPYAEIIEDAIKSYPNARVFWGQEEHKNMGAWSYMAPRLNNALGNRKGPVNYIGRQPSCTSANHLKVEHDKERRLVLDRAMEV